MFTAAAFFNALVASSAAEQKLIAPNKGRPNLFGAGKMTVGWRVSGQGGNVGDTYRKV